MTRQRVIFFIIELILQAYGQGDAVALRFQPSTVREAGFPLGCAVLHA